jgi:hypothetical protein
MRKGMPLAIACLVVVAGMLPAQAPEQIALPAPDPGSGPTETLPSPRPPSGPPQPYTPPPASYAQPPGPYGPPPGPYSPPPPGYYPPPPGGPYGGYPPPPPGPPPWVVFDSITNPCFWVGLDGLVFWTKNQPLSVPLITTGPAWEGPFAGNLGMPGTTSLDGPLNGGAEGGFRLYAGGWFNADHTIGMDGSFFILGQQEAGFGAADRSGVGALVLNEPVIGAPFNTQVSAPGVESGNVLVGATSQFWGAEVNLLGNLYRGNGWVFNILGGYRFLQLDESLTITANSNLFTTTTYTDNLGNTLVTAPPGSAVTMIDEFRTRNFFNGGQIGFQGQYFWRLLSISGAAKLAMGDTYGVVDVNGATNVFPINGSMVPLIGGNYATLQAGRYSSNRFALAPEAELKIGYQVFPYMRVQVGYDFLFLSSVLRPGNQIDNTYDGVTHPLVPMAYSSFWAQGLTLSLQFSF